MKNYKLKIILMYVFSVLLLSGCSKESNKGNDDSYTVVDTTETTQTAADVTTEEYYDEEEKKLIDLICGDWICETEDACIKIYLKEESDVHYYMNVLSDKDIHTYGEQLYNAPIFSIKEEIPHWYSLTDEEYPTDTEMAISISSMDGELNYGLLFIVDKDGKYLKYKMLDNEAECYWSYFYPYENDACIENHIKVHSLVNTTKDLIDSSDLSDECLYETALHLVEYNVNYFYPDYCQVTEMDNGYYKIDALSMLMWNENDKYESSEGTVTFYIDSAGNPVNIEKWEVKMD